MKSYILLILISFKAILSDEGEAEDNFYNYTSPCESQISVNKYDDCIGKACEFIEEKCCYLEALNHTTKERQKECIDFNFYDYMRDDLLSEAKEKIRNGEYWDSFNETYDEIYILDCNYKYFYPSFLLLIILFCFL